ncbi:MAG: bifunctional hydroxymethylpyrimidine kinase/phosphomethylpyrimidine kinase, partial [Planctomycetota bacterium]
PTPPVALTIAGSDSGGGAGIQADLKTFAFHGIHGVSAITCVTAQNTLGVRRVDAIPAEGVAAQLQALNEDFSIAAAKIGMLLNTEIMEAVATELAKSPLPQLVLDPVMVARSGDRLIDDEAVEIVRERLLPMATIVTPNVAEAEVLAGCKIEEIESAKEAATKLVELGAKAVLITGGGLSGESRSTDVLLDDGTPVLLRTECVATTNTHGTGCTLSAAIAANLALGQELTDSVHKAKDYLTRALSAGLTLGNGAGPVCHNPPS